MDETEVMLTDAVSASLQTLHDKQRLRQIYQDHHAYDSGLWQHMALQGWLGTVLDERIGGLGLQTRHAALIARQLGREVVPEPFVHNGTMLARLANRLHEHNPEAWQVLIERLLEGQAWSALAWQESLQSLDAAPACRLIRQPDGSGTLEGVKHAVMGADLAEGLLVSAHDGQEASLWWVPAGQPGMALDTRLGSDGSTVSTLSLGRTPVEARHCLGTGAAVVQALEAARDEALVLTSAQLLGVAEQSLALTLEYMRTRRQFGRAIGSFQSLQHLAVDVQVQNTLAAASLRQALQQLQTVQDARPGHSRLNSNAAQAIARAKARTSRAALSAARFAIQAHGAIGFAAEADIGLYLKAALRLSASLGNATFHRQALSQQPDFLPA